MEEPTIRFAQKEDINRLVELCKLHATFEKSSYDTRGKERKLSESLFSESPPLHCLVGVVNQTIIGYATYMKQFSTWDASFYFYMDCLFLTDEARGLGIGPQLIDRIKEEGREAGCSLIQWQTPAFNTRAIKIKRKVLSGN